MEIFIILLIGFLFTLFLKNAVEPEVSKKNIPCPPHKWESVENLKMRDGSTYSGLYCKICGSRPNYAGRE